MSTDPDAELMLRYGRGDGRAFDALYARHRGPLYRYLLRHSGDPDTASDLFQEVWGKVIAHRDRYQPRARFGTFLFRIAQNCCIDHFRRHRGPRRGQEGTTPADGNPAITVPAPDSDRPDIRAERAQSVARYRAALALLPLEQRDAFLLYEESGLSLEEIAAISGVGVETSRSRLRYAVAKLRAALLPSEGRAVQARAATNLLS
jgi:RNA polymerase sigma-70 factor, ECF subfamily